MTPEEKKEAKRLYDIEYRKKNKEKLKEQKKIWIENNPEKIKEFRENHKDKKTITDKIYAQKNKEKVNSIKQKWAKNNPDKRKESNRKYHNKKLQDPLYKLKHYIRNIIRNSLKTLAKKPRTNITLGCTYEEFKIHLESQFADWMTWDNYGNPKDGVLELNKTWDIDHIIPLASAKTEEELLILNHYTNLQPLCSYYNRFIKKDTI